VNVTAYLRVSTDRQEDGQGLDVQHDEIVKWAKRHRHTIVAVHRDTISGKLDERAGLADAIATLRDGQAQAIVVYRLDRLARDLIVQEQLLAEVRRAGGDLFSSSDAEQAFLADDDEDPSRKLIRQVIGAVYEFDRSMIALRLRNGRRRKHEQGGYAYGRPGYGSRAKDGALVVVPEQREVIDTMRRLRKRGATLRQIAAALDADGVAGPAGRGRGWSATAVQRALNRDGVKTTRRSRRTKGGRG
jgi:DNA invertase Pin-like site-specific DNA recombinase